jgi:hypothetical protein
MSRTETTTAMRAIGRPASAGQVNVDHQPGFGLRRSSNSEDINEAWMKQKADEVRAIKEEVRAARDSRAGGQIIASRLSIEQQNSNNSKILLYKNRSDSQRSIQKSPPKEIKQGNHIRFSEPNRIKSELKPRWNIPARSPSESELMSPKEVEFLRRREQRGAYLTDDEVERRQQAKITAIKSSQAAWWERNPNKDTRTKVFCLQLQDLGLD